MHSEASVDEVEVLEGDIIESTEEDLVEVPRGPRGEVGKSAKQKRINKLARKARAVTRNS